MSHKCHAEGCNVEVPPKMLMCRDHWRMVPLHVQQWVWREYRRGQEITKDPSSEYLQVVRIAVGAVAAEEARRGGGGCDE